MKNDKMFLLSQSQGQKDYMGLAIKNDNLVFVYNLKGEDVEIPLSSKPVSQWPAVFNYIKVERWSTISNVWDYLKTFLIYTPHSKAVSRQTVFVLHMCQPQILLYLSLLPGWADMENSSWQSPVRVPQMSRSSSRKVKPQALTHCLTWTLRI